MPSQFADLQPDVEQLGAVSDFVNEFLSAVSPRPWFAEFTKAEVALLSGYLECFGVPRDSVVLREGDEGDFLAILVTGRAKILKTYDGVEKSIHEILPGEMIGEMSLVDGQKRFASCVTTEPSDFAVLTRANLDALLVEQPRIGNKFLLMLLGISTSRLRKATNSLLPGLV